MERVLIGQFGVDSGQAMIGDPCYLDRWKHWGSEKESGIPFDEYKNKAGEYGYLGAANATLGRGFGTLGYADAVVFSTGYGDGLYPVYAMIDDGVVTKVIIDFVSDEEEPDEYSGDDD